MKNISVLMAMKGEAQPLIDRLRLDKDEPAFANGLPFERFIGHFERLQLSLVTSGTDKRYHVDNVATVPAALMAYLAIEKNGPDLIINAGTAGGVAAKGCRIGDVYLSSGDFVFHDRRIPLPGFTEYGRGCYPSFETTSMARDLKLKRGIVSTGNSLDILETDRRIMEESGAIIKDMEAAAIAWVCHSLNIPVMAIKAITDLLDDPTPTPAQFVRNLELASANLQTKTTAVLSYLGQPSTDLTA
jgi:nucleoside phosphorylase